MLQRRGEIGGGPTNRSPLGCYGGAKLEQSLVNHRGWETNQRIKDFCSVLFISQVSNTVPRVSLLVTIDAAEESRSFWIDGEKILVLLVPE